jgi:hypothetical protein
VKVVTSASQARPLVQSKLSRTPRLLGGLNAYGQIMRFFEKFTEGTDNIFKAAAILSEESKLTEALAKAGIDAGSPSPAMDELMQVFIDTGLATRAGSQVLPELTPIEVMAAELVKNTMPNYRRIGRFVRGLDRIPLFGNFTSFASENIRNSVNTVQRAFQEMAFRVPRTSGLYGELDEDRCPCAGELDPHYGCSAPRLVYRSRIDCPQRHGVCRHALHRHDRSRT